MFTCVKFKVAIVWRLPLRFRSIIKTRTKIFTVDFWVLTMFTQTRHSLASFFSDALSQICVYVGEWWMCTVCIAKTHVWTKNGFGTNFNANQCSSSISRRSSSIHLHYSAFMAIFVVSVTVLSFFRTFFSNVLSCFFSLPFRQFEWEHIMSNRIQCMYVRMKDTTKNEWTQNCWLRFSSSLFSRWIALGKYLELQEKPTKKNKNHKQNTASKAKETKEFGIR